jgi:hypothetical protein
MKQPRHAFLSLPLGMCSLGSTLLALPGKIRGRASASAGILSAFAGRIQPRPFFTGLLLGAMTMLGLGHWTKQHDTYGDRIRFFQAITPEKGVYPTIDNLAAFVRGKADRKKILVLIAGSSISLGVGQPEEDLWSRKLQEDLGEGFSVVNVSFRSNRFNLVGIPLMERLRQEFPRYIFISDLWPLEMEPVPLRSQSRRFPYNYIAWQELAYRLLRGEPTAFQQARGEYLAATPAQRSFIQEQILAGLWEAATGASAFWNWVGYRCLFTANPFLYPMRPVVFKRDDERKEVFLPSPQRFQSSRIKELEALDGQIRAAKTFLRSPKTSTNAAQDPSHAFWGNVSKLRTIFLISSWASYYLSQMPPGDQSIYEAFIQRQAARLRTLGFGTVVLGTDLPYSYYADGQHFSWEAAPTIAAAVAKEVRRISREQGY